MSTFQRTEYGIKKQTSSLSEAQTHWHSESVLPSFDFETLSKNELTVVTAYFDVGTFQKGTGGPLLTSKVYRKFMTVFAQIRNPVVAYLDNADHAALMRVLRAKRPETRVVVVDRTTLWSFRELEPRIAKIFSRPGYPQNPPNTVNSQYSAAMHAKYELMKRTIRDNPFRTAHFCWLDVGLFRELATESVSASTSADKTFRLALPPRFNASAVAYSLVFPIQYRQPLSAEQVVMLNSVWVCGCFFVGRVDVLWNWATEYLMAVEQMVAERWISTDQQLIYWLFHGEGKAKLRPRTGLQLYRASNGSKINGWFYLGYVAKKAGEKNSKISK